MSASRRSRIARTLVVLGCLAASVACAPADAQDKPATPAASEDAQLFRTPEDGQPVEAGQVVWGRDWDAAAAEAKRSGKPLFVQFQEKPG